MISRRMFLRGMGVAAACALLPGKVWATDSDGLVVRIKSGALEGVEKNGVRVFRGVPCGLPPYEGARRLALPQRVGAWSGTLLADKPGDIPLQPGKLATPMLGGGDCLRLNIWTPKPGAGQHPVMVYFPGGGSVNCNNNDPRFDGTAFAKDDVVLVTANYRVNVDGFLKLSGVPANLALRDMIFALEWVRDNIADFGGDPGNVTIFGQSAGATHITSLLASPLASGLFRRAILQSPSALAQYRPEVAENVAAQLCAFYGIEPTREAMAALPFDKLLTFRKFVADKARDDAWAELTGGNVTCFKPYIDGEVLTVRPVDAIRAGASKGVDVMAGCTDEEWRSFILPNGMDKIGQVDIDRLIRFAKLPANLAESYRKNGRGEAVGDLFSALQSDFIFRIPVNKVLESHALAGGRTWAYAFGWKSPAENGRMGAAHSCDLPFVFHTLDAPASRLSLGDHPPVSLADSMHAAWVRFAKTGDPGWSPFELNQRRTMRFDSVCAEVSDPWKAERQAMMLM